MKNEDIEKTYIHKPLDFGLIPQTTLANKMWPQLNKMVAYNKLYNKLSRIAYQRIVDDSLYDKDGEARAYIDYDLEATIFLWDGTPVAFVKKDGGNICIFDFRSGFLGWYKEGTIYDKKGFIVGVRKDVVSMMITKFEGIKGIQQITPIRSVTPVTPVQPVLMNNWSNTSLTEFLYGGK